MTLRALLAVLALLSGDPRLVPGQRLEGVERVVLEVAEPGTYTLGRSNGALVLGEQRSDEGWLVVELAAGAHVVEVPAGPGDVTAFLGAVSRESALTHYQRGAICLNEGRRSAARVEFLALLASPDSEGLDAAARMFLADCLRVEGRFEEARAILLAVREAVAALGQPNLTAFCENCLGQVALLLRDTATARDAFERLAAVADEPALSALAETRLAELAMTERDEDGARRHHEEALRRAATLDERFYAFEIRFAAGRFHEEIGDLHRATELYGQAAESAATWEQQVVARGQLASVHMLLGHYGRAEACLREVARISAENPGSPHARTITRNQAVLAFNLGDYASARELLEQLAISAASDDERASLVTSLALIRIQDDTVAARAMFEEALALAPDPGETRWGAQNGLLLLLIRSGDDVEEASAIAQTNLALAEELDQPFLLAASRTAAACAAVRRGEVERARALADAAVAELRREDLGDLLLPALHTQAEAALLGGDLATATSLLDEAWERTARAELVQRPSLEVGVVRSHYATVSVWDEIAADLLAARHAKAPEDDEALVRGFSASTRWRARGLLEGLAQGDDVPDDLPAALTNALSGRTLVHYLAGRERLYALVLDQDGLRRVDLGPRRAIEDDLAEYLAGIVHHDPARLASVTEVARVGRRLFDALLAPLGVSSEGLVISPTPELARLPFEALVAAAPESPQSFADLVFALDRWEIGYAPSPATLVALAGRPRREAAFAGLFGDPSYLDSGTTLASARANTGTRWDPLPRTRDEVSKIAKLILLERGGTDTEEPIHEMSRLDLGQRDELSTPQLAIRLGAFATPAALREIAPRCSLLHIAAHGFVDRWDARRTGLVLAWNEQDHGLLSLADILELDLSANLVVLSACQTADGRILHGEGVQSMAQAFLAAGARGVVATLWSVADPDSEFLVEHFARRVIAQGLTPERSLREAKKELRKMAQMRGVAAPPGSSAPGLGHPHFWAPFVYSGAVSAD